MSDLFFSASAHALNLLRLEDELSALADAGVDELYFAVRDGDFAPGFGFGLEIIQAVKEASSLACHAHLMVHRPERVIDAFVAAGCDAITVHLEATPHSHRALGQIQAAGVKSGLALNPATPLVDLQYLFSLMDRVLLLNQEPGCPAAPPLKSNFDRARLLRENIDYYKHGVDIEVVGASDARSIAQYAHFGVNRFVFGEEILKTETGQSYTSLLPEFHAALAVELERV